MAIGPDEEPPPGALPGTVVSFEELLRPEANEP
ncbi:hypothetical protein F4561_000719 [Lipingzhangella halophila]|uniref:Uncharacterized protein n=1 Tax=Lipingzhangella halophila TaxID=1783352 RepID=A0A7W7RDB7_9ACTN|nr:hypothetical protein [Lipingzhangella halophila]